MRLISISKIILLTAAILFLTPGAASAKKVTWTVKGSLKATHQLSELSTKFGPTSSLEGVLVKVSARTKVGLVWGTYNKWGEVRTDANGKFTISKDKNQSKRQFKLEVKFDDSKMELRHKTATSSLTKVKWYTVIKDKEKSAGTIDFGNLTFAQGGKHDLGDMEPRGHADIWKLMHLVIDQLEDMGSNFEYTTKLKIKYPHNGPANPDIPYANPTTKVVYIPDGWLTSSTVIHEAGHVLVYNHMQGEICLTETLILTQNTHGLVKDSCVAFGEGFAEYFKDKMMEEIFGDQPELPFNRRHISSSLNLTDLDLVQRHDMGWLSFFHTLSTANLHKYDFLTSSASGSSGTDIVQKSIMPLGCTSPNIGFKNVLNVFNENSSKGYPNKLKRDETTILAFLDRAKGILTKKMTAEYREMFEDLVRPQRTGQPSDWLCQIKQEKAEEVQPWTSPQLR